MTRAAGADRIEENAQAATRGFAREEADPIGCAQLLRYGRAHSAVTILEGILPSSAYAPLFAAAADLFGAENLFAYYYDLPFAETLARHATKPNRADFGEAEMRRWWQGRDLAGSLRETVFGPELSLEEAAAQVLRDVRGE